MPCLEEESRLVRRGSWQAAACWGRLEGALTGGDPPAWERCDPGAPCCVRSGAGPAPALSLPSLPSLDTYLFTFGP